MRKAGPMPEGLYAGLLLGCMLGLITGLTLALFVIASEWDREGGGR